MNYRAHGCRVLDQHGRQFGLYADTLDARAAAELLSMDEETMLDLVAADPDLFDDDEP